MSAALRGILSPRTARAMDTATYDKRAANHKIGHGYEARTAAPTSIVCHSTSNPNHTNTAFSAEATFLFKNKLASAHYLIGKDGATVRFLEPRPWAAWHAGNAQQAYVNQRSIGIELHHSVGDPPYPQAQLDALGRLLRALMATFSIPVTKVETHGQIAIAGPYQRKTDPSDWPHADFIRWRNALLNSAPAVPSYRAVTCAPVFQDRRPDAPLALSVTAGAVEPMDDLTNGWLHLQSGAGFSPSSCWEML